MPKLIIMGGVDIPLTETEAKGVRDCLVNGDEWVGVQGNLVNARSITGVFTDAVTAKKLTAGRLHDGTRVMLAYGRWVSADNPEVTISPSFYPEVTKDQIMDDETWEREIKPLPTTDARRARYNELVKPADANALPAGTTETRAALGAADRGAAEADRGDA